MSTLTEAQPLEGVRVVDWTHVLAGPFASYQLGLLGADVVRVEQPAGEDIVRFTAADAELARLGLGEAFIGQGAGKRSLALNVKDPAGREALRRLIASADVLVENFRPGKLAALGFDPKMLIVEQPRLIVCSINGFGPDSTRRAYDHIVQAASGLMMANANAQGVPQRIGFPLVDYAVGQQAAMAVLAALYRRDAAQESPRVQGEWLQVSMVGAALTLMAPAFIETLISGKARPRSSSTAFSGNPMSGTFEVADGWLAIVCNAKAQSDGLFAALREAGSDAALLARLHDAAQHEDVQQVQAALQALLRGSAAADWEHRLARWGVPASTVRSPAVAAIEASSTWPYVRLGATPSKPQRKLRVPGVGFRSNLTLTPAEVRPPPRRGQDTREVLAELGFSAREVGAVLNAGIAAEPPDPQA
jgi:crotonobetainyl-CoA:carnitine CoA-transferase CaiB-like acyl-CoA transferase